MARKDGDDLIDTLGIKADEKTGRPDADDENQNRSRDFIGRNALTSVLTHLEAIRAETPKSNQMEATLRAPELVRVFQNIRDARSNNVGGEQSYIECLETGRDLERIGAKLPSWAMDLCGEYVLAYVCWEHKAFLTLYVAGFSAHWAKMLGIRVVFWMLHGAIQT